MLQRRSGRTGRAGPEGVCVILVHTVVAERRPAQAGARIEATWQAAPSAEDIRAQDQQRLIEQVSAVTEAPEEDLALARALIEQKSIEEIAAAMSVWRGRVCPAWKTRRGERARCGYGARATSTPEPPRPGFEDAVWFKIDIGRNKNAEARWILPMVCRRGHATKRDIGAIRIFERETRFQVVAEAVERFEAAAAKGDSDGGGSAVCRTTLRLARRARRTALVWQVQEQGAGRTPRRPGPRKSPGRRPSTAQPRPQVEEAQASQRQANG